MRASQNGYHEVVRTLLEGGTDVNDKTNVRNQKMILMMMMMILMIVFIIMMYLMIIVINDEDRDEDDRISMYWC
jgi:ABC-type Na+ efflux pump permease subunit